MKRLCLIKVCLLFWALAEAVFAAGYVRPESSVAFYYGELWPIPELHAYDVVVVTPQENMDPKVFDRSDSRLYAYVTIGEMDDDDPLTKSIPADWVTARNTAWHSAVMDMANPAWRAFLIKHYFAPLYKKGYRGFFLDTLDSYQLSKKDKSSQEAGLVALFEELNQRFPDAGLIANRGFEVIPKVHSMVEAVVAESLYGSWDASQKRYVPIAETERAWLLAKLKQIKTAYSLPIIVVDYAPPSNRPLARQLRDKIASHGFIPWVGSGYLDDIGVGSVEIMPRRVLFLHDFSAKTRAIEIAYQPFAFVLEYMGLIPEFHYYRDIQKNIWVPGLYAGVLNWYSRPVLKHSEELAAFLWQVMVDKTPIVFLNNFGFKASHPLLQALGLRMEKPKEAARRLRFSKESPMFGYEMRMQPEIVRFYPLRSQGDILLQVTAENGTSQDAAAITDFGAYILGNFTFTVLPDESSRWVVNPFAFIKRALRLGDFPVPDLTTRNGVRIFTFHIDGDAFISKVPWLKDKYAGEVMYKRILSVMPVPATVSFIEREFEFLEAFPAVKKRLVDAAKRITRLPWVELATHTYSHPLLWQQLVPGKVLDGKVLSYPNEHYPFSYEKEIGGSSTFQNAVLAAPGKPTKMVLWSGDGLIKAEALRASIAAGITNLNGMAQRYTDLEYSITHLSALGEKIEGMVHVFSPVANDFVYSDDWSFPQYRFDNAIQTFALTDKTARYKPVSIYCHFYCAADQGCLRAMQRLFSWTSGQHLNKLFLSDYAYSVERFFDVAIAKTPDGRFVIRNYQNLREFRLASDMPPLNLGESHNVLGYNTIHTERYVHLGAGEQAVLDFSTAPKNIPYLVSANASDLQITEQKGCFYLQFNSADPLVYRWHHGAKQCQHRWQKTLLLPDAKNQYRVKNAKTGTVEICC